MKRLNISKVRICTILTTIFLLASLSGAISDISSANKVNDTNTSSNMTNATDAITYQVDVDNDYGFYRVIDQTKHKSFNYTNMTIIINVGDTVTWVNDATPDEPLTIVSEQDLWGNRSAYLRWNYQKFSYTFNKSGNYSVYIREYKRLQHQTIIVQSPKNSEKVTTTIISTPTKTYISEPIINNTIIPTTDTSKPKKVPISGIVAIIAILAIFLQEKKKITEKNNRKK